MTIYQARTDRELIDILRKDDHEAFNEIHERYFEDLLKSAYNILRDRDASMDVVQEVFVWFWEHRQNHHINSVKGYLLTAVKYQSSNHIRNGKVRENFRLANTETSFTVNEESLELKELQSIIKSFTGSLPEKCAEIFRMSREEHLSNKEIAQQLGISEKTVSGQLSRALNKLRSDLGKMHFWMYFFM
ncbi:RNA polymerase sigma-70 factor [Pedobacter psychroterrae]|uniref:RNA polymerase sigma-70 factor n=1 Tax=Pedobacter psychroterrae TaxID=2530453 RepID=A0A4R0NSR9_9SPHI|nr:RNA polymerase sigma-70 factor [Pedobacter psychroterrae]TCD03148.1 RNA polymerase sigma-70 factor [Pedobacter psychroterrae]